MDVDLHFWVVFFSILLGVVVWFVEWPFFFDFLFYFSKIERHIFGFLILSGEPEFRYFDLGFLFFLFLSIFILGKFNFFYIFFNFMLNIWYTLLWRGMAQDKSEKFNNAFVASDGKLVIALFLVVMSTDGKFFGLS